MVIRVVQSLSEQNAALRPGDIREKIQSDPWRYSYDTDNTASLLIN
jgi:hypothetical protein